jgi:hypothetical protein
MRGHRHARRIGLIGHAGRDLDRVAAIVKVLGMVCTAPDFEDHPNVINGGSAASSKFLAGRSAPAGGRRDLAVGRHPGRDRSHLCGQISGRGRGAVGR